MQKEEMGLQKMMYLRNKLKRTLKVMLSFHLWVSQTLFEKSDQIMRNLPKLLWLSYSIGYARYSNLAIRWLMEINIELVWKEVKIEYYHSVSNMHLRHYKFLELFTLNAIKRLYNSLPSFLHFYHDILC